MFFTSLRTLESIPQTPIPQTILHFSFCKIFANRFEKLASIYSFWKCSAIFTQLNIITLCANLQNAETIVDWGTLVSWVMMQPMLVWILLYWKKLIQLLMVYWSLQQYYRHKIIHSLMPHVLQHSIVTYIFYTHRNTMIWERATVNRYSLLKRLTHMHPNKRQV